MDTPDTGAAIAGTSSESQTIGRWSRSIDTADHLALLAGDTILTAGSLLQLDKRRGVGFPLSIDRKGIRRAGRSYHATTSAQCLVALQRLHGALDVLRVRTRAPHQNVIGMRDAPLEIDKFRDNLRRVVGGGLGDLTKAESPEKAISRLSSDEFGVLNPLTCAHVLRALTPNGFLGGAWWWAVFCILHSLSPRSASLDVAPGGAVLRDGQATAFVSAMCVDAISSVLGLLNRRWLRLQRVIDLLRELVKIDKAEADLGPTDLKAGFADRRRLVNMRLVDCLGEFEFDTALPDMWVVWKRKTRSRLERGSARADFLAKHFSRTVRVRSVSANLKAVPQVMKKRLDEINDTYVRPFEALANLLAECARKRNGSVPQRQVRTVARRLRQLRTRERTYAGADAHTSAETALGMLEKRARSNGVDSSGLVRELSEYWAGHAAAARGALELCGRLAGFLSSVLDAYVECKRNATAGDTLESLTKAACGLDSIAQTVREAMGPAVRWAESVMTRQMAYFHSGQATNFDAAELSYAAYTVVRSGAPFDINTILAALEIVAKVQRSDGTWAAQQAIIWRESGVAAYAHSIQVASAVSWTVGALVGEDDVFALRPVGLLARLTPIDGALDRVADWLAGSVHEFRWAVSPDQAPGERRSSVAVGWCSDRGFQADRIDVAVTASVVEFLLAHRDYYQLRINIGLAGLFAAYPPAELPRLLDVKATDLDKTFQEQLLPKVVEIVGGHERRRLGALSFRSGKRSDSEVPHSIILAGPPGTSKTTVAKAIARELNSPLLVLSPSDFLARGEENVEARAREIFELLGVGSRLVYLFDEVDELLLAREYQQREATRSVFSFLTPSFLTKLQDLHDVAKRSRIIFVIGTNYLERIDPAARRKGRIDRAFEVLYPDWTARVAMAVDGLAKLVDGGTRRRRVVEGWARKIADATELFSYNGVGSVCAWVVRAGPKDRMGGLERIGEGRDQTLRPEIELSLYSGRPGAVEEFLGVLKLCRKRMDDQDRTRAIIAFWDSIATSERGFWQEKVVRAVRGKGFEAAADAIGRKAGATPQDRVAEGSSPLTR